MHAAPLKWIKMTIFTWIQIHSELPILIYKQIVCLITSPPIGLFCYFITDAIFCVRFHTFCLPTNVVSHQSCNKKIIKILITIRNFWAKIPWFLNCNGQKTTYNSTEENKKQTKSKTFCTRMFHSLFEIKTLQSVKYVFGFFC